VLDQSLSLRVLLIAGMLPAIACSDDNKGTSTGSETSAEAGHSSASGSGGSSGRGGAGGGAAGASSSLAAADQSLPIVFVHGFAGSAQQFQSQAMRYVMNGFPAERLRAYEHDGAGSVTPAFLDGVDQVIDEVRAKYKVDKVYLIGHSRGTSVSSMYLADDGHAAKVAKYVSEDGGGCSDIPVPCVSPAQTTNTRAGQTDPIPGQKHVEIATSKESFAIQYKFLFDRDPKVVDIVKQSEPVKISGRAVNFPANTGREGATLNIWEIDGKTGARVGDKPLATFTIGGDGNWGPVTVDPSKHYEQVLSTDNSPNQHHFYSQPFLRSTEFVRLLSGPPDSDSRTHTNTGDHHAAFNAMRMREWTTDDVLEVSTASKSGNQDKKNVITSEVTNNPISVFLHDDAATPGETSLALLPWFPMQPFQTGVDVFMPANDKPDGTITLTNLPRGASDRPQTLNVPNWASTRHSVTVMFNDYPQD
jgi:pimeloyl-ACP methyl ester carboxylesterase